jgi:general stress protein 26
MASDNISSEPHDIARVWELMKDIGYAMLVTSEDDRLRARPMAAFVEHDEHAIYFLTDARHHTEDAIARSPAVNLSFADISSHKYVSVSGRAATSNDRAKINELFATPARAWWDNADDPNIRVLKITPDEAEFWDSPGGLVTYVKMAAAVVSGTRPAVGDKRKVAM